MVFINQKEETLDEVEVRRLIRQSASYRRRAIAAERTIEALEQEVEVLRLERDGLIRETNNAKAKKG